jgi:hypothetical protein
VLPDAHAWDEPSANENRKLPAVEASHTDTWVRVSDVPPFVQAAGADDRATWFDDGAAKVKLLRVVDPAAAFDAAVAPGSPVWSLAYSVAGAVKFVARRVLSQPVAKLADDNPAVIAVPVL